MYWIDIRLVKFINFFLWREPRSVFFYAAREWRAHRVTMRRGIMTQTKSAISSGKGFGEFQERRIRRMGQSFSERSSQFYGVLAQKGTRRPGYKWSMTCKNNNNNKRINGLLITTDSTSSQPLLSQGINFLFHISDRSAFFSRHAFNILISRAFSYSTHTDYIYFCVYGACIWYVHTQAAPKS